MRASGALLALVLLCICAASACAQEAPLTWGAPVAIDPGRQLVALSCPSASLCVAVDASGNALTSTDPTAGASAWRLTPTGSGDRLVNISCPSPSLCVAIDGGGNALA